MRIGFDFDRVLFDTDSFNKYLKDETGLYHVEGSVYDENGCYSPEKHAEMCSIDVDTVYEAMDHLNQFLFSDIDDLRKLSKDHELVIVTRGKEKVQRKKVKNSGAQRLFDELFILQEGPKDIVDIDFLVDDTEEEIEKVNVPGIIFDREKHSIEDVIEAVGREK